MKTRSIIVMAGATLLAGSLLGGNLVRAFPTAPAPAAESAAGAPYQWHGYFGPRLVLTDAYVPSCALRKMWVDTDAGPRLKWRRACPAQS